MSSETLVVQLREIKAIEATFSYFLLFFFPNLITLICIFATVRHCRHTLYIMFTGKKKFIVVSMVCKR